MLFKTQTSSKLLFTNHPSATPTRLEGRNFLMHINEHYYLKLELHPNYYSQIIPRPLQLDSKVETFNAYE
jgi:hypothetical protein